MASLSDTLQQFKSSFGAQTPPEILETLNRSISLVQNQSLFKDRLLLGESFPDFELQDIEGRLYSSIELLKTKPLIVTFVRGGWCPYCMLEMQAWQKCYEKYTEKLNIVAITPELPHFANTMKQDNNLSFPLLFVMD